MIQAVNTSFTVIQETEFGLPVWKYYQTSAIRKLFEAQDVFTL